MSQSRDDEPVTDRLVATVGATVKFGRKRLGLSVQGLSEAAGVSLGLVSQLERGIGNPGLQTIQRIAGALGVPVGHLLDGPSDDIGIVRVSERHVSSTRDDSGRPQPVKELLTPRGSSLIQVIRTTLPAGFTNEDRPFRHLATESVTVERGRLHVAHGARTVTLEEGDSATYACSTPHWWANACDGETVVIGSVVPFER